MDRLVLCCKQQVRNSWGFQSTCESSLDQCAIRSRDSPHVFSALDAHLDEEAGGGRLRGPAGVPPPVPVEDEAVPVALVHHQLELLQLARHIVIRALDEGFLRRDAGLESLFYDIEFRTLGQIIK